MTPIIFLIAVLATVGLAIFVRIFWVELLITWAVIRTMFYIVCSSFISALSWTVFFEDSTEGFELCWLYFGITYTIATIVFYFIVLDLFHYGIDFIRKVFKIR